VVEVACYREIAFGGGDPEVGAPSVEDDGEVLRRRADADDPEVLGVEVVDERDLVAAGGPQAAAVVLPANLGRGQRLAVELVLVQADPEKPVRGGSTEQRGARQSPQAGGRQQELPAPHHPREPRAPEENLC